MALIVEDGTGVLDANTYVNLSTVREYATARGITLPAADRDLEPHVHKAMDWFESHVFTGCRNDEEQSLSFPRNDNALIPTTVVKVLCEAATTSVTIPLQPQYAGTVSGNVKRKKLDVLEKEYFEPTWSTQQPRLVKLNSMIQPLIGGGLGAGRLTVSRV